MRTRSTQRGVAWTLPAALALCAALPQATLSESALLSKSKPARGEAPIATAQPAVQVTVTGYKRRTLYHSPQTPGYTCWTSLWANPDKSVMLSFTQATGSLDAWRPRTPPNILKRLPKANQEIAGYDMNGLFLENIYLQTSNGGKTWRKVAADSFPSPMNGMCGGSSITLPDGTMLRVIWGQDLPFWDVPQTGFIQRSADHAKTWGAPELVSKDPRLQTWPKRLRWLRDGRLALTGAACDYVPDQWIWDVQASKIRPCLWVSRHPLRPATGGRNAPIKAGEIEWEAPIYLAPEGANYAGEEWDLAELANGDLLGVLRVAVYDSAGKFLTQERRQCLLTKEGNLWKPGAVVSAPFPHSGQPELLMTREGVLLHIASNGIWQTSDRGGSWTKIAASGSAYYPTAVQLEDGTILVTSHVGSDDPYGKVDQSIVLDTFRIKIRK